MKNSKTAAHRLSLTDAVAYLAPRPRSRNHSRNSSKTSNSPTQEFSDPVDPRSEVDKTIGICERMLEEGQYESVVILLERLRKTPDLHDFKPQVLRLLFIAYAGLGKWDEVEKLAEEKFDGLDETFLDLAQKACDQKDWTTVEEVLAFSFKGREDIQRTLAVEYYDRGEWNDAELLLTDLFRGRKEYTAEGLKAMHMLANIKYNKEEYDEAEDYAIRAVNGRRIILGTQHVFYFQSVNLLVKIYEAMGDVGGVQETSAMLPIGFRYCAELEHLSHMPPKEAAAKCGVNYLKDVLQHDARNDWLIKEVRANIELSGKGVVGTGYGYSLIHAFADWGYLLAAQLLIEKGVDIEAKTKAGETPLILASESGMESTVKMFLERGANIEARTDDDNATALLRAIRHSRHKVVKLLLNNNANIEASDSEGDTALSLAVMYSNEEMVKLLLNRGPDHEAQNNEGRTALMCAVVKGRSKNLEMLLDFGVDVQAKDNRGRTALNYAQGAFKNSTIAKLLVDEKRHLHKEPNWFQRRRSATKVSE